MLGVIDNIVYGRPFIMTGLYILLYIIFGIIDTIVYLKSMSYTYKVVNNIVVDIIFYATLVGLFQFTLHRYGLSYWTTTTWFLVAIIYACSTPWVFIIRKKKRR